MADFEELRVPVKVHDIAWRVRGKCTDGAANYLLNDKSYSLADFWINPGQVFNFPTEHDAHASASEYYTQHGRHYPHTMEWATCLGVDELIPIFESDEVKSQVMEFE